MAGRQTITGARKVRTVGIVPTLWDAMGMLKAMPGLEWVFYTLGTGAGLLGALAMIARRAWAESLSLIALIAVLVEFALARRWRKAGLLRA